MKAEIICSIRKPPLADRANPSVSMRSIHQNMIKALWWAFPLLTHRSLDRWL